MPNIETFSDEPVAQNLDLTKLHSSKIFIATACYGGMVTEEYHRSMINLTNIMITYIQRYYIIYSILQLRH